MPDRVTLDVIDRPAGGVRTALRDVRALRRAAPPGLRALLALGTVRLVARPWPALTPRRIAVRYVPAFLRDNAAAVAHAFAQPGYLGGLGINSSRLNTTSCSCWRTYREAREYAFRPGGHAHAMRRDREEARHRTEYFLRVRPRAERGTLDGAARLAVVLPVPWSGCA